MCWQRRGASRAGRQACWTSELSKAAGQLNGHPLTRPSLACSTPQQLSSVSLCFNPTTYALIDCPTAWTNCEGRHAGGRRWDAAGLLAGCSRVACPDAWPEQPAHGQPLLQWLDLHSLLRHSLLGRRHHLAALGTRRELKSANQSEISLRIRFSRKAACSFCHCPPARGRGASCSAAAGHSAPLSPAPCSPAAHATVCPLLPWCGGGASQARLAQS